MEEAKSGVFCSQPAAGGSFHEIPRRTSESSTCTEWVDDSATDVPWQYHPFAG